MRIAQAPNSGRTWRMAARYIVAVGRAMSRHRIAPRWKNRRVPSVPLPKSNHCSGSGTTIIATPMPARRARSLKPGEPGFSSSARLRPRLRSASIGA